MREILFRCPECSKSLAVGMAAEGRDVGCLDCGCKVTVPTPAVAFACPQCGVEFLAGDDLLGQDFECPGCEGSIPVPALRSPDLAALGDGPRTVTVRSADGSPVEPAPADEVARGGDAGLGAFRPREEEPGRRALVGMVVAFIAAALVAVAGLCVLVALTNVDPRIVDGSGQHADRDARRVTEPLFAVEDAAPSPTVEGTPTDMAEPEQQAWDGESVDGSAATPALPAGPAIDVPEPRPAESEETGPPEQAPAPSPAPGEMAAWRTVYDRAVGQILTNHLVAVARWPVDYLGALSNLQARLQQDGDLDGWTAVGREIDDLRTGKWAPSGGRVTESALLIGLRRKHMDLRSELDVARGKDVAALTDRYLSHLGGLRSQLTKDGNIDAALVVDAEIKSVGLSPAVASARFAVAELEAAQTRQADREDGGLADEGGADAAAAADDAPPREPSGEAEGGKGDEGVAALPPAAPGPSVDAPQIYAGMLPPEMPDMDFRRLTLVSTREGRTRRKLQVVALVGTEHDVNRTTTSNALAVTRSTARVGTHAVRLGIRLSGAGQPLRNPLLAVQYFARAIGRAAEPQAPAELAVEYVGLALVSEAGVYVDCPPVTTREAALDLRRGRYFKSSRSGDEFEGIVVTVFDADGSLVYQAASESSLQELGVRTLPHSMRGR